MFGHVGKRTDRNSATAARAKAGVFVGITDNCPAYLMYIIDDNKVVACGYATFDVTQFPLKKMLLAGQSLPQDFAIDTESFRKNGFKHPQDLDDDQVAEYATRLRLTLELPPGFVKDYPGPWRAQCSLTRHVRKTLHVVLLLDRYHGEARKAPMISRYERTGRGNP